MSENHPFPKLQEAAGRLGEKSGGLSLPELRDLLCRDCDFFHEDHEDDLECSCFRVLRMMLERGRLTPSQLADMVGPPRQE